MLIGECEEIIEKNENNGTIKLAREGLKFIPEERLRIKAQARINGPIYDSRSGIGNLYRYAPRDIERLCKEQKPGLANWLKTKFGLSKLWRETTLGSVKSLGDKLGLGDVYGNEVKIDRPKIHHSVFKRLTRDGNAYAPINLPGDYAYVDSKGNVIEIGNPGAKSSSLPETAGEAKVRRHYQTFAWNKVWGRKLLYFTTLAAIFYFIIYPYWVDPGDNGRETQLADFLMPWLGTFSALVHQIPVLIGKIPGLGFAETWASRYQSFPFVFILSLLVIAGLLTLSWHVNRLLKNQMRLNWQHVAKTDSLPKIEITSFRKTLARFLNGKLYTNKIARPLRIGFETVAVLFLVALLAVVGSRLFFTLVDAAGGICDAGALLKDTKFGENFEFDPADACLNTGLSLKKGKTYQIQIKVENWKDKEIEADVKGWCRGWCRTQPPWYLSLFTPIRRHLLADWYQPIARIDDKLLDRYPLKMKDPDPSIEQNTLSAEITARRTGMLYLYLNDAVLFTPGVIDEFYANNKGRAWVTVTNVESK